MDKKYVTIIDTTGRNILGVLSSETTTELTIANPVMVLVQPQNGQFQVQLIPLFLAEFIKNDPDTSRNFNFTFNKSNIAVGVGFSVDDKITIQYDKIIEATNTTAKPAAVEPEIIKLFED